MKFPPWYEFLRSIDIKLGLNDDNFVNLKSLGHDLNGSDMCSRCHNGFWKLLQCDKVGVLFYPNMTCDEWIIKGIIE